MQVNFENFPEMLKYIKEQILTPDMNQISVQLWDKELVVALYDDFDVQLSVMKRDCAVTKEDGKMQIEKLYTVELLTELLDRNLTPTELQECAQIGEILENNIDLIKGLIE